METIESEPQVTANRRGVAFTLLHQGRPVECIVSTAALEAWFWLEPRASDARMLKTFNDGYPRIRAIAERRSACPSCHASGTDAR
ncbi:hypothetical protein PTKU64_87550 [Paraburkholderia terrae]|uniref:DUF1488 domain-containing protein n=1 Tax=Paraburkholderia terrae TaxID=311230 RepID=A0ABM7U146_9BURK|nr:hypothetical protein PTKU64_87550 [Paraburkholderia terrae]